MNTAYSTSLTVGEWVFNLSGEPFSWSITFSNGNDPYIKTYRVFDRFSDAVQFCVDICAELNAGNVEILSELHSEHAKL